MGKVLYCGQEVDPTQLVELVSIPEEKSKEQHKQRIQYTNFYTTVQPMKNSKLRYHASDMILIVHSNTYYLS